MGQIKILANAAAPGARCVQLAPVNRRRIAACIAWPAALSAVFFVAAFRFVDFTIDDSYIYARYAANLLRGDGLVFNQGEPVEGFSSPLAVLLLSTMVYALGTPLLETLKSISLAAGLITIVGTAVLARRLGAAWLMAAAAATLVAVHPGLSFYAASGMETSLYTALTVLGIISLSVKPGRVAAPLIFGALSVTRPEGPFLLVIAMIWWFRAQSAETRGMGLTSCAILLGFGPTIAWVVFRRLYYGQWLPNVYYAKPGISDLNGLAEGATYIHSAVEGAGGYALAVLAAVACWAPRPTCARIALTVGVAQLAFAVFTGGDWMLGQRFALPIIPTMYSLAAAGSGRLPITHLSKAVCAIAAIALGASHFRDTLALASDLRGGRRYDHAHVSTGNVQLGAWLRDHSSQDAIVATDEVGAIAFASDRKVVDMLGLTDPEIAGLLHRYRCNPYTRTLPEAEQRRVMSEIAHVILRRRPDFVLIDYRPPVFEPLVPTTNSSTRAFVNERFVRLTQREMWRTVHRSYEMVHPHVLSEEQRKVFLVYRLKDRNASVARTGQHDGSTTGGPYQVNSQLPRDLKPAKVDRVQG